MFKAIIRYLLCLQFTGMKDHGTRIVLYNLWEDDQGHLELDFDTDPYVSIPLLYSYTRVVHIAFYKIMLYHDFFSCGLLGCRIFKSEERIVTRRKSKWHSGFPTLGITSPTVIHCGYFTSPVHRTENPSNSISVNK